MRRPDPVGRVLVVGDVMTDIICKPEGPLVVGSDRRALIRMRPGGSGANQAVWMAAFGLDGPSECSGLPVERFDATSLMTRDRPSE